MSKTLWQTMLLVLALFLVLPSAAAAQEEKSSNAPPPNPKSVKSTKPQSSPSLQDVTLVSTAAAVRKVAEEASSKAQAPKAASKTSVKAKSKQVADGAVLEFHPESNPTGDSTKGGFQKRSGKKSVLKNIHGSAYGAAASTVGQANGEGGAIGADSSNGKLNIYVEGEHTHASTPAPH
jgi:hypothetical protein